MLRVFFCRIVVLLQRSRIHLLERQSAVLDVIELNPTNAEAHGSFPSVKPRLTRASRIAWPLRLRSGASGIHLALALAGRDDEPPGASVRRRAGT
jgi:hypothetical protein